MGGFHYGVVHKPISKCRKLGRYQKPKPPWKNCRQRHFTRHFSHAVCTFNYMHITLHGSRRATQCVCVRASFHLHVIHDVCLSVRCLSLPVCASPVSLRRLPLLFHTLPLLCPALHLQCRQRRGIKPLRICTMRSTAPWRKTILSQVMSPTSSTTSTTQRLLR